MNIRTFRASYLLRRFQQIQFEKTHPGMPWLTQSAALLLDSYLKGSDIGLEWGAGRSSL